MSQKFNKFPARIYAKTVLEPDLDIYKKKFPDDFLDALLKALEIP